MAYIEEERMETPEVEPNAAEEPSNAKPLLNLGWLWPAITNEVEAKNAALSGGWGAAVVAALTGTVSVISIATKSQILGVDGWALVDAILFAVIAWRVFNFSFPWALVGLLTYCAELYWRWTKFAPPKGAGLITTGLIVLSLVSGVRGTVYLSRR